MHGPKAPRSIVPLFPSTLLFIHKAYIHIYTATSIASRMFARPLRTRWYATHSLTMCHHPPSPALTSAVHFAFRRVLSVAQPRFAPLPTKDTRSCCIQPTNSLAFTPTRSYTSSSVQPSTTQGNDALDVSCITGALNRAVMF